MKYRWSNVAYAAGFVTLLGCGATMSFKPGAQAESMAADERACREVGDANFVECMRNRGWYVKDGSGEPTQAAVAVEATPVPVPATPAAPPVAPVEDGAPSAAAATATLAAAPTATATTPGEMGAPTETASPGPLARVRVGSWWKLGGTAAGLDGDIAGCVENLGPSHQPNANASVVTVGLRDCLRADGWHAYDEAPLRP